ncbi:MAG: hypothetical protein AAF346_18255 [Pseudomonadota bacterium]
MQTARQGEMTGAANVQTINVEPEPPSIRYIRATQPWWVNVIFWVGRLALAGAILSALLPILLTLAYVSNDMQISEKPTWATGYNSVWIALWFLQIMMWSFLAVTLYRGLHGLPVLFKDRYVEAFSFDAAAIWSLFPLALFLLPLQLARADLLVLPNWVEGIYNSAAWIVNLFGWLL